MTEILSVRRKPQINQSIKKQTNTNIFARVKYSILADMFSISV